MIYFEPGYNFLMVPHALPLIILAQIGCEDLLFSLAEQGDDAPHYENT